MKVGKITQIVPFRVPPEPWPGRRTARSTIVAFLISMSGAACGAQPTPELYRVPLSKWPSIPSIKTESVRLPGGEVIGIPQTDDIFIIPSRGKNMVEEIYFAISDRTFTLVDFSEIDKAGPPIGVSFRFSTRYEDALESLSYDTVPSEIDLVGEGAEERPFAYRCKNRILGMLLNDRLECRVVVQSWNGTSLQVDLGFYGLKREDLSRHVASRISTVLSGAIEIEQSFVEEANRPLT
jgi:hypothetical protein